MAFRLKNGTRVLGLRPEILLAVHAAQSLYDEYDVDLVITSAVDGTHSRGSFHYNGLAVDFRTRTLPSEEAKQDVADRLGDALGPHFDVVLEDTHIHVEYQPKTAINS